MTVRVSATATEVAIEAVVREPKRVSACHGTTQVRSGSSTFCTTRSWPTTERTARLPSTRPIADEPIADGCGRAGRVGGTSSRRASGRRASGKRDGRGHKRSQSPWRRKWRRLRLSRLPRPPPPAAVSRPMSAARVVESFENSPAPAPAAVPEPPPEPKWRRCPAPEAATEEEAPAMEEEAEVAERCRRGADASSEAPAPTPAATEAPVAASRALLDDWRRLKPPSPGVSRPLPNASAPSPAEVEALMMAAAQAQIESHKASHGSRQVLAPHPRLFSQGLRRTAWSRRS